MAWFRNELPPRVLINQLKHLDMPSKMSPVVNYNNLAYAVAGEAAAKVAGMSYAELIETKILNPLGLKDAGLSLPEMKRRPNYAMPYDAASYEEAKKGIHEEGYMDEIPLADAPAGDIYMNVLDLAKWGSVIMKKGELNGKQVLNKGSIQETLKSHNFAPLPQRRRDFAPTLGYGLGWMLDTYKGHTYMQHGMYCTSRFFFSMPKVTTARSRKKTAVNQQSFFLNIFLTDSHRWRQPWIQIQPGILSRR